MKERKRKSTDNIEVITSKAIKTEEFSDDENATSSEKELTVDMKPATIKTEDVENDVVTKEIEKVVKSKPKKSKMDKNAGGDSTKKKEKKKKKKIDEVIGMNKLVENIRDKKNIDEKSPENAPETNNEIEKKAKTLQEINSCGEKIRKNPKNDEKTMKASARKKVVKDSSEMKQDNMVCTSKVSDAKGKELGIKIKDNNSDGLEKNIQDCVTETKRRRNRKIRDKNEGISKDEIVEETMVVAEEIPDNCDVDEKKKKNKKPKKIPANKKKKEKTQSELDEMSDKDKKNTNETEDVKENVASTRKEIKQKSKTKSSTGHQGLCKKLGAHVSIIGGIKNAVLNAVEIGAKSFAMFLKSQRQWAAKPLTDNDAEKFKEMCRCHEFLPHLILPHGSYLMNCGSPKQETLEKSRAALVDELKRCEKLGLTLFNFHPGSTCGKISVEECLERVAESINQAHSQTKSVICVIENMSCQGNTVGGKFSELRGIIDRVKDKSRIGVCLDTCHAFAAGYNLASEKGYNEMMEDFEKEVGFQYLKGMHINDSKGKVGCHLDRHENIGCGHIGEAGFKRIMMDDRLNDIPLVLETPCPEDDTYAKEIKMMYKMCSD